MNRHQVLTGACNFGDQCYAVGSVEGIHFTAYAGGCDIVILASDFQRVQIIPGVTHGNVKVSCIDCCTDSGKIAASYQNKVYIFEPTPLLHHESSHPQEGESDSGSSIIESDQEEDTIYDQTYSQKLDYQWYQTSVFEADGFINSLSWNMEGSRLITGGDTLQLWQFLHSGHDHLHKPQVQFSLGHEEDDDGEEDESTWHCIWTCRPATPVYHLRFSPDGLLFASAGKADRMVKIWFEDRKLSMPLNHSDSIMSPKREDHHFSFIYVAHPRAVTGFSWRKTSKYMPRGAVANMLVTSCVDNVCRIWVETILPDDGLIDIEQFDPSSTPDRKFHTHRHKKRFMQRLKTISNFRDYEQSCPQESETDTPDIERHAIHKRKKHHKMGPETIMSMPNLSSMSSVASVHDFHKFALHNNGTAPLLHFHLAASVNPETDIPLIPVAGNKNDKKYPFQLHWLNNKELQFTLEAEVILQDLHKSTMQENRSRGDYSHSELSSDHAYSSDDTSHNHVDHHEEFSEKGKHGSKSKKKKKKKKKKGEIPQVGSKNSLHSDGEHTHDSISTSSPELASTLIDALDRKIEVLLKDWHQHPDMLFSIHPEDGSFLVWLVDWLDEYTPYCFRQAQISFSSKLPNAFPIPDARTMANSLYLYCNYSKMDIKSAMKISDSNHCSTSESVKIQPPPAPATGKCFPGQNDNMLIPNVLLITKHLNGSLNQWQISFMENSKFSTVLSVAHASRACGHRFRTNSAVCHPALPLLLTTSHHNVPKPVTPIKENILGTPPTIVEEGVGEEEADIDCDNLVGGIEFCSELILWRVDPVGPLSKSGGIVELARINSPQLSAFSNVAWVPTLLSNSSLGSYSNSPSALFIASDGRRLVMYQAVIDARTLLMEVGPQKKDHGLSFCSNTSSGYSYEAHKPAIDLFNIVSLQSSVRPGCIIEMEELADAMQDWQNTQLLHVFQEQLVTGNPSSLSNGMEAIIDLRTSGAFSENFYLIVLERRAEGGSIMHMWKINISSQACVTTQSGKKTYVQDYQVPEGYDSDPESTPFSPDQKPTPVVTLSISTTKVCTQPLPLPGGVNIVSACPAAGHLSSASIYPACLAPYLVVTACSDGAVRFWNCETCLLGVAVGDSFTPDNIMSWSTTSFEYSIQEDERSKPTMTHMTRNEKSDTSFEWKEWQMIGQDDDTSSIFVKGKPISVSCAYSGRVAVAYRLGGVRITPDDPKNKYVNLYVAVYECESTGGSEWLLEDTIELKNISIPDPKAEIDLDIIFGNESFQTSPEDELAISSSLLNIPRTRSVPSLSTIFSVRKCIAEHGNTSGMLQQKHLVQLDWVSTEDGSHILTVGIGSRVLMYAQVSQEVGQSHKRNTSYKSDDQKDNPFNVNEAKRRRDLFQKSKSMIIDELPEEIKWMKLRSIELTTADGLPPLPMHLSWVRGGIMVVGMDNEMHVYSQWRGSVPNDVVPEENDKRSFDEDMLTSMSMANFARKATAPGFKPSYSIPSFKHLQKKDKKASEANLLRLNTSPMIKSESVTSLSLVYELGLFESSRQANPVLPQYHPKKLMELLNFGKVRRVKAILAHLVRFLAGGDISDKLSDEQDNDENKWMLRSRAMSISAASSEAPMLQEEVLPDYKEMSYIPPLPIYALLAADQDYTVAKADAIMAAGQVATTNEANYNGLFDSAFVEEELDTTIKSGSFDGRGRSASFSGSNNPQFSNPHYFGVEHALLLTKQLTHTHLPNLSSLDQMYLLALADTVASTRIDFEDRERTAHQHGVSESKVAESLDECGMRFILSMRHHIYLLRILPPRNRVLLKQQGLRSYNLVWAFHSEATEELLTYVPSMQKDEPNWEDMKQFGAGWWINNINILKRCIEKIAKAAFQKKKDPMDAAIYYIALRKKNVLWGLYRSIDDKKMMDFFKNDFNQERWRKAALKNAFALLGRQRFMHAAAFFLLAGALKDAVEVCIDKLQDIQLALVLARLHADEMLPPAVVDILKTRVLGISEDGQKLKNSMRTMSDPFFRSMACWLLKDYQGALNTLLLKDEGGEDSIIEDDTDGGSGSVIQNVFNFYNFLRTHPLLLRQRMAATGASTNKKDIIHGFTRQQTVVMDDNSVYLDRVTPQERQLFFATAHSHYMNGCPILSLEVLSKLPPLVEDKKSHNAQVDNTVISDTVISSGTISDFEGMKANTSTSTLVNGHVDSADSFDWSKPVSKTNDTADAFDWGVSVSNMNNDLDEPDFKIDDDEDNGPPTFKLSDDEESEEEVNGKEENSVPDIVLDPAETPDSEKNEKNAKTGNKTKIDIFAQQYKFISCLKVLMEEMQTLATGFEVDGGQLRFQLYIWLEREVEVLQYLCNYGSSTAHTKDESLVGPDLNVGEEDDVTLLDHTPTFSRSVSVRSDSSYKPTLHEVILADKMDFEAKLERMSKRKQWLKTNQQLLRTLASFCVLQGSGGGGLASVEMELLLLLQELQQDKPQQQLLSPLPFPTTLPLLSASIASSKTVIADPIQHIQCMSQDLLHTIVEMTGPPGVKSSMHTVYVMENLCIALAACIYQCLCDCDSFVVSLNEAQGNMEDFSTHNMNRRQSGLLMAGVQRYRRRASCTPDNLINTPPAKWPGVTSLRVLLAREKDEACPKLNILLCESLFAVYVSLLVNALATYDSHMLYRLVVHRFNTQMWAALFGGGVKTQLKFSTGAPFGATDDLSKGRMKLILKGRESIPNEKVTYKETFVPPELSMVSFFMTKPFNLSLGNETEFDYDSEDSETDDDEEYLEEEDDLSRPRSLILSSSSHQHLDPTSYSWALIRYAVVKLILHNLQTFLPHIGIELQELPICSTLMHAVMKTLERWMEVLKVKLDLFAGPPEDFIQRIQLDIVPGDPQSKYKVLLDPENTPFNDSVSARPLKRLWFQLLKNDHVKDIFLRYIYRKKKLHNEDSLHQIDGLDAFRFKDPMKIIHKEQDIIMAFALNQEMLQSMANTNCLVLATQKDIVELDIGPLIKPPAWLEDDNEMDIEHMKNPSSHIDNSADFYVVQTPSDNPHSVAGSGYTTPQTGASTPTHSNSMVFNQTGRGSNLLHKMEGKGLHIPGITNPQISQHVWDRSRRLVKLLLKRPVSGVRRIGSHPNLPHYLTGGGDGSVRLYEWGHMQPLAMLRQPGAFPKVTKVLFSSQGNKCCVSDAEGSICLWQVGLGSNFNKPILSLRVHNKTTSDFSFVGSSSLIAVAGHSSESKNVSLWDTLVPPNSACVHSFVCHEHGCPAIVYAPHHQLLISGGRKGELCIFDIRQRQLRHTFQAHDSPIRCLAMDPEEEYFVTGSAEGDIKVWGLDIHQLVATFPGEHSKNTFFRQMGSASGVTQLAIGSNHHLFSCGIDGSMKFRELPDREQIVRGWPSF